VHFEMSPFLDSDPLHNTSALSFGRNCSFRKLHVELLPIFYSRLECFKKVLYESPSFKVGLGVLSQHRTAQSHA